MTKNKDQIQELKKQLEDIQQKIAEIEKEEDNEEQGNCLIKTPSVNYSEYAYYISDVSHSFMTDCCEVSDGTEHDMHFSDEEQCKRYAEALTTFILLRKQPGSEAAKYDVEQYVIELGGKRLRIESSNKTTLISPCFNSEESARKAIETLGEERILSMFKYFHS